MIKNYLKIAFRNIWRYKLLSALNILSLSLGIAACLLIYLFINDEQSFDAFHTQKDAIYRMDEIQSFPGTNTQNVALTMPGMGPALHRDYPEVLNYTRVWERGRSLFERDDERFLIENIFSVDSTFLRMFDFELISGDRSTALDEPYTIVIDEEVAELFFGDSDPLGETLKLGEHDREITGVMKNVPENSHLQFDILISMATVTSDDPEFNSSFGSNYLTTYVLFNEETDIRAFEQQMAEFLTRCMPPDAGSTDDVNDFYKIFFQPLPEVHLTSMNIEHDYLNYRKFNGEYLRVFGLIGILILLIAGVNFMNLITARASQRGKEVGVRKTIGALKRQLFTQFVTESALLAVFAFIVSLLIAFVLASPLSELVGRDFSMTHFLDNPLLLVAAFTLTCSLGVLAGVYPSLYMASFDVTKVVKGGETKYQKSLFRSSLVVLQFGLAIGMIICTLVVAKQFFFMQNVDTGFKKDHILLVDMNREANNVFSTLKTELNNKAEVLGVTASGQRLGNNFHQWGFKMRTDSIRGLTPSNVNVDFDYLDVYEMSVIQGRGFDEDRPRDNGFAFVINESFANELNLEDPIGVSAGHSWYDDDSLGTIIGVVKDFNFNSLHYGINTLSMVVHPEWGYDEMSVKVRGDNLTAAIAEVEQVWNGLVPNWPFDYTFLDEHFAELYRSEQQLKSVVQLMALLAILIACMGLFGLAAITTEQRTKEIGIRKVLGATVGQIMIQLSKRFAFLVLVAFVIFSPVTFYMMNGWLENYAERVSINGTLFAIGFLLAFAVAVLTVSYHAFRSAIANPVHALRSE